MYPIIAQKYKKYNSYKVEKKSNNNLIKHSNINILENIINKKNQEIELLIKKNKLLKNELNILKNNQYNQCKIKLDHFLNPYNFKFYSAS